MQRLFNISSIYLIADTLSNKQDKQQQEVEIHLKIWHICQKYKSWKTRLYWFNYVRFQIQHSCRFLKLWVWWNKIFIVIHELRLFHPERKMTYFSLLSSGYWKLVFPRINRNRVITVWYYYRHHSTLWISYPGVGCFFLWYQQRGLDPNLSPSFVSSLRFDLNELQ